MCAWECEERLPQLTGIEPGGDQPLLAAALIDLTDPHGPRCHLSLFAI